MLAITLAQVFGALWALVLNMVAFFTEACTHSPVKSELPLVAPYDDPVSHQFKPKASAGVAVPTHAYGVTSVQLKARINNGFKAFFDSTERLDDKEGDIQIDDIETMKSEWSKLLKQGSESNSTGEDDDLYFFSSLTTKKPSPEPGQFHDAVCSIRELDQEAFDLVDISCSSSPSERSTTDYPLSTSSSHDAFNKFQMFRFPLGPTSPDCASPIFSPGPWSPYEEESTGMASEFSPSTPMTISIGKRGIVVHDYGDFDKGTLSTPGSSHRGYDWTRDAV